MDLWDDATIPMAGVRDPEGDVEPVPGSRGICARRNSGDRAWWTPRPSAARRGVGRPHRLAEREERTAEAAAPHLASGPTLGEEFVSGHNLSRRKSSRNSHDIDDSRSREDHRARDHRAWDHRTRRLRTRRLRTRGLRTRGLRTRDLPRRPAHLRAPHGSGQAQGPRRPTGRPSRSSGRPRVSSRDTTPHHGGGSGPLTSARVSAAHRGPVAKGGKAEALVRADVTRQDRKPDFGTTSIPLMNIDVAERAELGSAQARQDERDAPPPPGWPNPGGTVTPFRRLPLPAPALGEITAALPTLRLVRPAGRLRRSSERRGP